MGRRKRDKKTAVIRIDEDIARMIEVISVAEKISAADIASPILEKAIKSRYLVALETLRKEREQFG